MSLLLLLSAFIPLVRKVEMNDLEWLPLINEAFVHSLRWGHDVIFTYGPWGFVWSGYDPRTFSIQCLFWTSAGLITWWVMWNMARQTFGQSALTVGAVLWALALALGGDYTCSPDVRLMVLPVLLLLYHFFFRSTSTDPAKLALIALIAFTGLVKFPYLITGIAMLGLICVDPVGPRLKRAVPAVVYFLTLIIGWLLAGQRLSDIPEHVRWSMELTRAYDEAMALWTPGEAWSVGYYLGVCALLLIAMTITSIRALKWRATLFLGGLSFMLFVAFRSGFVRHDLHEMIATGFTMEVTPLAALAAWSYMRGWATRVLWSASIACAAIVGSRTLDVRYNESLPQQVSYTLTSVATEATELIHLALGRASTSFIRWQQYTDVIAKSNNFPTVHGTADLFPKDAVILLARGMNYSPRPTLQSYVAQTPALSRLDAAKLAGPDAPDNIFLTIDLGTPNLPTINDSFAWLEMLSRYRLAWMGERYLLLVKREVPHIPKLKLLAEGDSDFNSPINISRDPNEVPGQLLWVQIEFRRRPLGVAMAKLYKAPEISIVALPNSGTGLGARLIPENASGGFLLGPLIFETRTVALLEALNPDPASWEPLMPKAFVITGMPGSDPSWYFQDTMHIKFFGLTFENAP